MPYVLTPAMLAAWIGLPSLMAAVIGGWVPHIYRSARRAALSQRDGAGEQPANGAGAPADARMAVAPSPMLASGLV